MTKNKQLNVSSLGELVENGINRVSIAIGVFDGVHRGHQLLLKRLVKIAKKNNSTPIAMTFYPHPEGRIESAKPAAASDTSRKKESACFMITGCRLWLLCLFLKALRSKARRNL